MNRKTRILITSYFAAGVFIAAGLLFTSAGGAEGYRVAHGIEVRRAMAAMVSGVSQMDSALKKGSYAQGTGMAGKVCGELMSGAQSASTALSILPLETYALEELAGFLSQMEEYARVKGDLACSGTGFSAADREKFAQLQAVTDELVPVLSQLYVQVSEGGLSVRGLLQPAGVITEESSYLEDELLALLEDFPEAPQLIYEGSLSDDYDNSYGALAGLDPVEESAAMAVAEKLTGDGQPLTAMGVSYGELPCYYFGRETEEGSLTVAVSRQGGLPVLYLREQPGEGESLSEEAAVALAEDFLGRAGYGALRQHTVETSGDLLKLRYVDADGGVTDPNSGVDLSVALSSGTVVSMDAGDYLRTHKKEGAAEGPAMSAEEVAAKAIPKDLEILKEELTWFTRDTGTAVLCRRYLCEDTRGKRCVIYADANRGVQIEIRTSGENMSDL